MDIGQRWKAASAIVANGFRNLQDFLSNKEAAAKLPQKVLDFLVDFVGVYVGIELHTIIYVKSVLGCLLGKVPEAFRPANSQKKPQLG